jgi:hypothetical protein
MILDLINNYCDAEGHVGSSLISEENKYLPLCLSTRSRDSLVGIVTGYGLDSRCSIPGRGKRIFSTPQRTDRLWGPLSLLSNRYRGLFPRD